MKKLLSIILSITMLLSMATVAFADETASTGALEVKGVIKVGVNAEFAPFEYYENDKLTGFDIDLMNYISERIGYGVEFVNMSFDKLIPAVVSGDVDCVISAITVTEARESVVDYTRPYLAANVTYKDDDSETEALEEYAVIFPENSRIIENITTPDDKQAIYHLVDNAIKEFIDDATIEKLIEKYDLNKPYDEETDYANGYYEYNVIKSTVTDTKNDLEIPKDETRDEATTVPAPSEWAAESIDIANELNIIYKSQEYIYKSDITREEFCELIYNFVILVNPDVETYIPDSFTDTKNEKVLKLASLGIVNGKTATEFAPDDSLTREEAATIIIRMVNKVVPLAATEMWFEYDDMEEISEWASNSIQTISNLGFMKGVGNNKFAPKDTYTTEQAITTLVIIYQRVEEAGAIDNASTGIIGGADGPTSIIVGENTSIIGGTDAPTQIMVTDTIKVDDFYIDEAIKLTIESGKFASDKELISYYTANEDMTNKVLAIGAVDYSKPTEIYYMAADREQIINNLKALSDEELDGFDIEKLLKLNKVDFSVIGNMINSSYGVENLAALTILTNSRGYIMPKDFDRDFALYLQYDGEYSALVSFSVYGDGVISARMTFVNNGDRDNIFSRLYEITQGLGEDSIDVAKVK